MAQTIYELKQKMALVGAELAKVSEDLMTKAANPSVPIDEIKDLQTTKANLQTRFDLIKDEHDRMEADQKAKIKADQVKDGLSRAKTDNERLIAAKAEFFRASILKRPVSAEVMEVLAAGAPLQANPAGGGTGGENFLPSNLSDELICEPFVNNPLRTIIGLSNIKGLELPKIAFELDGDGDFITDEQTAAEINATGDKVAFGRFKFKVKVRVSDTVLHGSDINLVTYIENALRSGLAAKEKATSFAAFDPSSEERHMSFYAEDGSEATLIESVEGATLFAAITAAIADLHEMYRENAKVCMRYADYISMISTLANGNATLYTAPPESILGKPATFCDLAETPIVGDFKYYHLNYDGEPIYDSDKNVDKGEYIWVLTCWFDQRFKLYSAFRLAEVTVVSG